MDFSLFGCTWKIKLFSSLHKSKYWREKSAQKVLWGSERVRNYAAAAAIPFSWERIWKGREGISKAIDYSGHNISLLQPFLPSWNYSLSAERRTAFRQCSGGNAIFALTGRGSISVYRCKYLAFIKYEYLTLWVLSNFLWKRHAHMKIKLWKKEYENGVATIFHGVKLHFQKCTM